MRYLMFLAMIACSGSEKPADDADDGAADGDADTDADGDTDSDADTDADSSSETGTVPPTFFEPIAVGFEYIGGILADGTLQPYRFPGDPADTTYVYPPIMLLTFASLDYFSATDAAGQTAESCVALAYIDEAMAVPSGQIPVAPVDGGQDPVFAYEFPLPIDPAGADSSCFDPGEAGEGRLDPAIWGPGGSTIDLLDAFNGAHFAFAFGPLTPYAQDGFAQADQDDPEVMAAALTEYIAINDPAANWVGIDWTHAVMFAWDEETREVLIDAAGAGTFLDVTSGIPSGYVSSGAHWLQDFIYMDLTNLKE